MTDTATPTTRNALSGGRLALLVGGLIAVVFGVLILVWPTKAAVAVTALIASYAIISGAVHLGAGVFSRSLGAGARVGLILLGILSVVAGAIAFGELRATAAFLAVFLTVLVGAMWIVEGFVSLLTLGSSGSRILTIVFAIVSVIAGFTLITSPVWGAVFLWWFLAIALIAIGALNVARAVFRRSKKPAPQASTKGADSGH